MLALVGSDGEGLFHQAIRLVAIAVGTTTIRVGFRSASHAIAVGVLVEASGASLALHLAIG